MSEPGGTAVFFMITWGFVDRDGRWQTGQLVARDLSLSAEADMIKAWQADLKRLADMHGVRLEDIRPFHWGSHETLLPDLNWFPILRNLVHEEPVTVRGDRWSRPVLSRRSAGLAAKRASAMLEILTLLPRRAQASLPEAA